jgi:hypothetical protein
MMPLVVLQIHLHPPTPAAVAAAVVVATVTVRRLVVTAATAMQPPAAAAATTAVASVQRQASQCGPYETASTGGSGHSILREMISFFSKT